MKYDDNSLHHTLFNQATSNPNDEIPVVAPFSRVGNHFPLRDKPWSTPVESISPQVYVDLGDGTEEI